MFLLVAVCLLAQAAEPQRPPDPSPLALERIRRQLDREVEHPLSTAGERKLPTFRVYINEKTPPVSQLWSDDGMTPLYVKTFRPLYHHEFLTQVTPEEFRAGALYPIGVDLIAVVDQAVKGIRKALRARAEAQARAAVQKELEQLLEARKAAGLDR